MVCIENQNHKGKCRNRGELDNVLAFDTSGNLLGLTLQFDKYETTYSEKYINECFIML